jgi:16S rRNA (guanine(1405)-N(7))-methyltransferase
VRDEAQQVVAAVAASRRYRSVDPSLVRRLAVEELARARSSDDAIKRVKRRLHQSVGAYRAASPRDVDAELGRLRAAAADPEALRAACRDLMARHASTKERLPYLEAFYPGIWSAIGAVPRSLLDLGCGLAPLALPWMGLPRDASYQAIDADAGQLALVDGFLALAGQPHVVEARDLAAASQAPLPAADTALLLKLVPILDRQLPGAATRLLGTLDARHAVVSFPVRSLGGRGKGMERTYRQRFDELARDLGKRLAAVSEVSVPNELVFVLALAPRRGSDG